MQHSKLDITLPKPKKAIKQQIKPKFIKQVKKMLEPILKLPTHLILGGYTTALILILVSVTLSLLIPQQATIKKLKNIEKKAPAQLQNLKLKLTQKKRPLSKKEQKHFNYSQGSLEQLLNSQINLIKKHKLTLLSSSYQQKEIKKKQAQKNKKEVLNTPDFKQYHYTSQLIGNYKHLGEYLYDLKDIPVLFRYDSILLEFNEEYQQLELSIDLEIFAK